MLRMRTNDMEQGSLAKDIARAKEEMMGEGRAQPSFASLKDCLIFRFQVDRVLYHTDHVAFIA